MKIYLAGAFFNTKDRATISYVADALRKQGHDVHVPMEHKIPNAWDMSNEDWAHCVFDLDVIAINNSDCVVAVINNGMNDDTGTIWEIGFAYGIGKHVFTIHNYDVKNGIASLMVWNSSYRNITIKDIEKFDWVSLKEDTIKMEQK